MDIAVSIVLAAILVALTLKKKAFTLGAALTAAVILVTAAVCGSYGGIFIVLAAYGVIFAVDLVIGDRSERVTGQINQKSGARDVMQVLSNALAAVIALVIGKIIGNDAFIVVYAAALTECLADSLASDVGVLSKKDPVDICRFKRVRRGISGGVSLLGSLSAFAGCLFMALFTVIFFGFVPKYFLTVLLTPMVGMLADSVMGSLLQAKYTCTVCGKLTEKRVHCDTPCRLTGGVRFLNNDAVNIISNFITALLAAAVLI